MYIINLVRMINLHFAIPPPGIPSDYLCNPLSTITFSRHVDYAKSSGLDSALPRLQLP
jgi:hypothetical protein